MRRARARAVRYGTVRYNGEAAYAIINEIKDYINNLSMVKKDLSELLEMANETLRDTVEHLNAKKEVSDRFGGAMPFLMGKPSLFDIITFFSFIFNL